MTYRGTGGELYSEIDYRYSLEITSGDISIFAGKDDSETAMFLSIR